MDCRVFPSPMSEIEVKIRGQSCIHYKLADRHKECREVGILPGRRANLFPLADTCVVRR